MVQKNDTESGKQVKFQSKNPAEVHYMRRLSVKHQKRQLTLIKLAEFPLGYMVMHCILLAGLAIIYVSIQIALIVYKSSLYYVCSGFWVAFIYILCIVNTALLSKLFIL